jgi:hypothetical protein
MQRKRLVIAIILVVIIVAAAFIVYFTSPSWLPRSTTMAISPANGAVSSGTQLALVASVKYGSAAVGGGTISWQTTGGSLSGTTGSTVVFTAPNVTSNQTYTVTASFGGTGVYQPSSATAQVTVSPPPAQKATTTTLSVTPSQFELHEGKNMVLNAVLSPAAAPVAEVSWTLVPASFGSLSSTSGATVTYTAPIVQQNATVTITASFAGNAQYTASGASSAGKILPPNVVTRNSTSVVVSPSSFVLESNVRQALTAWVESNHANLTGASITWTLAPASLGSLSATTGDKVTYTAPTVQKNTTVTITASYAGNATFVGSSAASTVTVTPPSILQYVYTMGFTSATMTKVSVTGPIVLNGTRVTLITAETANLSGFSLSRFGLTASTMYVNHLVLYSSYVNGYSTELGGNLAIKGGQTISMGPKDSVSFGNTTMGVLRMEGSGANLTGMASAGQYVGGSEPYVPSIITAPTVSMSNKYSITGPATWKSMNNMVSNITTGRIDLPQFQLLHPSSYILDRHSKTFSANITWSLSASSATALKVSAFIVYFGVTGGEMVRIVATGSDNPNNLIPFGLNTGGGFNGLDVNVQPVYFAAAKLGLGSFVISITPPSASAMHGNPALGLANWSASNAAAPRLAAENRLCKGTPEQ